MTNYFAASIGRRVALMLVCACVAACSANSGPGVSTTTVLASDPNPPTISLAISPRTLKKGDSAIASWDTTGATSCTENGSWTGAMALSNTSGLAIGPMMSVGTFTFGATCVGPGGTVTTSQTVTVGDVPAPGIEFQMTPAAIKPGDSALLVWSTTNATTCSGTGGTSTDGWAANQPTADAAGFNTGAISTAGQYTYELDCTGPGGTTTESRILTVDPTSPAAPPIIAFSATKTFIQPGDSTSFSWSSSNATACTASGGTGSDAWSGAMPVSSGGTSVGPLNGVGTFSYTLSCTGAGGSSSKSVSVVVSTATQPPPVTLSISVSPTQIVSGDSAALSWTTTNAQDCTATGSWSGSKPLTGSSVSTGTLTTPAVYSYTLTCTGAGGGASGTASASLTVNPPAAVITGLTATPTAIQTGQASSLSWNSSNATDCTASGGTGSDGWTGAMPTSSSGVSTGAIAAAGSYTYTLNCTGPGGASAPQSATVTVSTTPPPASISNLKATPASIQTGQSTSMSWSTSGATSCVASGGTGSDGWSGSVPTSSAGLPLNTITVAGSYVYTLVCTGPGGSSPPSTANLTVTAPSSPASIVSFVASPSSLQVGQSSNLSWVTTGATGCTATGGTGTDGWTGAMPTASAGTSTGALNSVGVDTYTLTCTGPGGASAPSSATVTVNAAVPGQPTVTLTANNANPAQIQPGHAFNLQWTSTNSTSCTASGGTGSDGWSGTQTTSSSGLAMPAIATPGVYSYTLTCSGAGGTGSSTVALTVISSSAADCGVGSPSTLLLSPSATASSSVHGLCLIGCSVTNTSNVVTASTTDYATMSMALGVAAYDSLKVTDNTTSYPAGREAGFLMADPNALLSLSLLQNVTVQTLLNGTVQETATAADILELKALGLLNDPKAGFVEFKTSKPFNSVVVDVGSLASVLSQFKVYGACVTLQ